MNKIFNKSIFLDKVGMMVSGLCAIHCSVLPLLILIGAGSGMSWLLSHEVEIVILITSVVIASLSLIEGYFKVHHRIEILALALLGFVFLFVGHGVNHLYFQIFLTTVGGLLILASHYFNFRYRGSKLRQL